MNEYGDWGSYDDSAERHKFLQMFEEDLEFRKFVYDKIGNVSPSTDLRFEETMKDVDFFVWANGKKVGMVEIDVKNIWTDTWKWVSDYTNFEERKARYINDSEYKDLPYIHVTFNSLRTMCFVYDREAVLRARGPVRTYCRTPSGERVPEMMMQISVHDLELFGNWSNSEKMKIKMAFV